MWCCTARYTNLYCASVCTIPDRWLRTWATVIVYVTVTITSTVTITVTVIITITVTITITITIPISQCHH